MEGQVRKNTAVIVISVVAIIFFILWFKTISEVRKYKNIADRKAAAYWDLEEKNAKLEKERFTVAEELKAAQAQLAQEKTQYEETKKVLSQEQVAEQALKVELERVTRLKEALESDLKGPLSAQPKVIK